MFSKPRIKAVKYTLIRRSCYSFKQYPHKTLAYNVIEIPLNFYTSLTLPFLCNRNSTDTRKDTGKCAFINILIIFNINSVMNPFDTTFKEF